jgi:hypothetical protein
MLNNKEERREGGGSILWGRSENEDRRLGQNWLAQQGLA